MVDITITIPDDKVDEFKEYFLYLNPIPLDDEGEPKYTLLNWFKQWLYEKIIEQYRQGKRHKKWAEHESNFEVIYELE